MLTILFFLVAIALAGLGISFGSNAKMEAGKRRLVALLFYAAAILFIIAAIGHIVRT
ncbi:hypothetical protein [Sphingomicrobium lutaoense]|uniref:Uncharacterized protein n=1 Tax=Sphingomicrobium lutaoense TaxID=515949 RepID=A0A839Z1S5_9SPHN|nr:hypothetical protein [Sphingomicrobium lutaoense]MBB3764518.1 hypothetical protein [Sphingomicrobium lutaoense]